MFVCSTNTDEIIAECEKYLRSADTSSSQSQSRTPALGPGSGSAWSTRLGLASTYPPPVARAKESISCAAHAIENRSPIVRSDELLGAAVDELARLRLGDGPAHPPTPVLVEGFFTSTGCHRDGSRFRMTYFVHTRILPTEYKVVYSIAHNTK